jgi:hypothetical protein
MNSKKVRPANALFLAAVALLVIIGFPKVAANSTRSVVLEPSKAASLSAPLSTSAAQRGDLTKIETGRRPTSLGSLLATTLRIAKLSDEPGLLILFGVALIGISSFLRRIF